MNPKTASEYLVISIEETIGLLGKDENGLTEPEAQERIERFGHNEVLEKERTLRH